MRTEAGRLRASLLSTPSLAALYEDAGSVSLRLSIGYLKREA